MLDVVRTVDLPMHEEGDFDHGDAHLATGRVFIANTAGGTVEVVDVDGTHLATIPDCPEASGVLCAQRANRVFAVARGAGLLLTLDLVTLSVISVDAVGTRPNGLAWDDRRERLFVADVADNAARIVVPGLGVIAMTTLPGRPRWCVFDETRDRFLVNVREPAAVMSVDGNDPTIQSTYPISSPGPHGLDRDAKRGRAYVACDGGKVVALDETSGEEIGSAPIPGVPDAIWFNPRRDQLYVAIGKPGRISVIDTTTMHVEDEVVTEEGAGTTAFDVDRQQLHVFLSRSCRMTTFAVR